MRRLLPILILAVLLAGCSPAKPKLLADLPAEPAGAPPPAAPPAPIRHAAVGATVTFAIVGDGYTDQNQFHADATRIQNFWLTVEPFKSRAAQISFAQVENTVDLNCVYSGRLLVCDAGLATTVVKNTGVPFNRILVLVNNSTYGGSGGGVAAAYNGQWSPQVAVHESGGHSFGGLIDEYNLYSTNGFVDGQLHANCLAGTPPNAVWNAEGVATTDYTQGCDYPNWYRPASCSIMSAISCLTFDLPSQQLITAAIDRALSTTPPTTANSTTTTSLRTTPTTKKKHGH